ncbi:MAG: DUF4145 domain-containing protein [Hymenobacter sp.]|nr:MAG: DUF4145 domain-containing protein [Hymenobacter sp.]
MPQLVQHLSLTRCPHCQIDNPNLSAVNSSFNTNDYLGANTRTWQSYRCTRCGGGVLAGGKFTGSLVAATEIYPKPTQVDENLPRIAKEYLTQAVNSLHAPAGSVMLCASSIDAMLKAKGYDDPKQSLYKRIEKASDDHLITEGMREWAHEIRLDANDQRHADQGAELPTTADAQRSIEFAQALGQFLFVLPARVAQGRAAAQSTSTTQINVSTQRESPGVTQADVAIPRTSLGM